MSRIGKMPIEIPSGVSVAIENGTVQVKGPKGKLSQSIPEGIKAELSDNRLMTHREGNEKRHRAYHGLVRSLLANAVEGVTKGFEKKLDLIGVGFRAEVRGKFLRLSLGYSHPILVPIPTGIEIEVDKSKKAIQQFVATITVKGFDKGRVGQMAADIRALRKPDVYKGKGIRYENETIKLKVGKKGG